MDLTTQTIMGFESFRAHPYYDQNHYRIGYGSDTWTDADGDVHNVTRSTDPITREDAARDLARRIPEFQQGVIRSVGQDAWDALPENTQAAITSLAYNYGSLSGLPTLRNAIQAGDATEIARAVRNREVDNNGENRQRRNREADLILGTGPTPLADIPGTWLPENLRPPPQPLSAASRPGGWALPSLRPPPAPLPRNARPGSTLGPNDTPPPLPRARPPTAPAPQQVALAPLARPAPLVPPALRTPTPPPTLQQAAYVPLPKPAPLVPPGGTPTLQPTPTTQTIVGRDLGSPQTHFNTPLTPPEQVAFQQWKQRNAPNDSGEDYDLPGAFLAGVTPAANGHFPDTFKKPNHPTFSDESQYAAFAPARAGTWTDDGRYLQRAPNPALPASFNARGNTPPRPATLTATAPPIPPRRPADPSTYDVADTGPTLSRSNPGNASWIANLTPPRPVAPMVMTVSSHPPAPPAPPATGLDWGKLLPPRPSVPPPVVSMPGLTRTTAGINGTAPLPPGYRPDVAGPPPTVNMPPAPPPVTGYSWGSFRPRPPVPAPPAPMPQVQAPPMPPPPRPRPSPGFMTQMAAGLPSLGAQIQQQAVPQGLFGKLQMLLGANRNAQALNAAAQRSQQVLNRGVRLIPGMGLTANGGQTGGNLMGISPTGQTYNYNSTDGPSPTQLMLFGDPGAHI